MLCTTLPSEDWTLRFLPCMFLFHDLQFALSNVVVDPDLVASHYSFEKECLLQSNFAALRLMENLNFFMSVSKLPGNPSGIRFFVFWVVLKNIVNTYLNFLCYQLNSRSYVISPSFGDTLLYYTVNQEIRIISVKKMKRRNIGDLNIGEGERVRFC